MKNTKKFVSVVLAFCMLGTTTAVTSMAVHSFQLPQSSKHGATCRSKTGRYYSCGRIEF